MSITLAELLPVSAGFLRSGKRNRNRHKHYSRSGSIHAPKVVRRRQRSPQLEHCGVQTPRQPSTNRRTNRSTTLPADAIHTTEMQAKWACVTLGARPSRPQRCRHDARAPATARITQGHLARLSAGTTQPSHELGEIARRRRLEVHRLAGNRMKEAQLHRAEGQSGSPTRVRSARPKQRLAVDLVAA
jgi:hypothetical protein